MQFRTFAVRPWIAALLILGPLLLGGCGSKKSPPASTTTLAATEAAASGAVDLAPETLEALVAPIALYPDVVIGHVLLAATNPQEVLDAGNWLLEHADLPPAKLDQEATKLGMSTSMRALLPFPETVDMMCREIDWTTDLGAAFNTDQAAVLDAVQRMRKQAVEVGNLQTSEQLKVESTTSEGKPVVLISPPKPEVIYVPTYDPVAVYAPPPATVPPPTQTVVVEEKSSSNTAIVGLLCFTAGVLIADAAHDNYYGYPPHYGYGGIYYGGRPYYPPPPYMYRPPYGGGYYPAHGYHPPGNYNHNFNNNTIVINQGDNNYWNNDFGGGGSGARPKSGSGKLESPITKANPNRAELNQLNQQGQERTRKAAEQPKASTRDAASAKTPTAKPAVKGTYAGTEKARSQNVASAKATTGDRAATAAAKPATGTKSPTGAKSPTAARPAPSTAKAPVDRGYAGKSTGAAAKTPSTATARPTPTASQPTTSAARPQASKPAMSSSSGGGSAFSGSGSGSSEQAASQRGRTSTASSSTRASSSSGTARTGGRSR